MKTKKQYRRRGRSAATTPGRTASCLPFLNEARQRMFFVHVLCERGFISHLLLNTCDRKASSLEKRASFLEKHSSWDMEGGVRYEIPRFYMSNRGPSGKKHEVPAKLTLEAYRTMMKNGDVIPFLGAAFPDVDILEESGFIAALIVDGRVEAEKVLYF